MELNLIESERKRQCGTSGSHVSLVLSEFKTNSQPKMNLHCKGEKHGNLCSTNVWLIHLKDLWLYEL